jgi:hypothetical protein
MKTPIRPRGNVGLDPLAWTIESASREHRISSVTLRKYLRQSGIEPAEDGTYTTTQITGVLFGDIRSERLRTQREMTRRLRRENEVAEGALVSREGILQGFASLANAMTCHIRASKLDRLEQDDLLRELADLPVIVTNAATGATNKQTGRRSRYSKNGKTPVEEDEND